MKPDQKKIYYVTADTFVSAKNSPHLEIFRKKGIEVLLLSDRIDEWLVGHLTEYQGKPLQSVAKGSVDMSELTDETEKKEQEKTQDDFASLLKQVKDVLGDKIKEARITYRLTQSPACLVSDEQGMTAHMQRLLKAAGQDLPANKPIFELNPEHPLIKRLQQEQDDARFSEWTTILFEQSVLAEGGQLEDPATFVQRLNKLFLELAHA